MYVSIRVLFRFKHDFRFLNKKASDDQTGLLTGFVFADSSSDSMDLRGPPSAISLRPFPMSDPLIYSIRVGVTRQFKLLFDQ